MKRALTVARRIYAPSNPLIAEELTNIGSVRFQQANYPDAERYYRLSLEAIRQWYGEDNPYYASVASFLSQPLSRRDATKKHERYLRGHWPCTSVFTER